MAAPPAVSRNSSAASTTTVPPPAVVPPSPSRSTVTAPLPRAAECAKGSNDPITTAITVAIKIERLTVELNRQSATELVICDALKQLSDSGLKKLGREAAKKIIQETDLVTTLNKHKKHDDTDVREFATGIMEEFKKVFNPKYNPPAAAAAAPSAAAVRSVPGTPTNRASSSASWRQGTRLNGRRRTGRRRSGRAGSGSRAGGGGARAGPSAAGGTRSAATTTTAARGGEGGGPGRDR